MDLVFAFRFSLLVSRFSFPVSHFLSILFNFPTIIYLSAIVVCVFGSVIVFVFAHSTVFFHPRLDYVCWMNEPIRESLSMENCAKIFSFPFNYLVNVHSIHICIMYMCVCARCTLYGLL